MPLDQVWKKNQNLNWSVQQNCHSLSPQTVRRKLKIPIYLIQNSSWQEYRLVTNKGISKNIDKSNLTY